MFKIHFTIRWLQSKIVKNKKTTRRDFADQEDVECCQLNEIGNEKWKSNFAGGKQVNREIAQHSVLWIRRCDDGSFDFSFAPLSFWLKYWNHGSNSNNRQGAWQYQRKHDEDEDEETKQNNKIYSELSW